MSQDYDMDHDEFDKEELQDLEGRLYAKIHHDSDINNSGNNTRIHNNLETFSSINSDKQRTFSENGSNKRFLPNDGMPSKRPSKRYWDDGAGSSFISLSSGKRPNANESNNKNRTKGAEKNRLNSSTSQVPIATAAVVPDNRPKSFKPYVSLLSCGSYSSDVPQSPTSSTTRANETAAPETISRASNKTSKNRQKNSESTNSKNVKRRTTDKPAKSFDNGSKKRLNPFSQMQQAHQTRKTKYEAKKDRANKNREKNKNRKTSETAAIGVVNVDDNGDDDEDDDVIILPTQAPPLICVDTSDESEEEAQEQEQSNEKAVSPKKVTHEHEFTEPNSVSDGRRTKTARCASPSGSIQSADDFLPPTDRQNTNFETFGTVTDDDLYEVCETVENALRKSQSTSTARENPNIIDVDNAVFTPPKRMQKEKSKSKASKPPSYEVGDNSFAAVDVYESESSDMVESIYAIGRVNKRKPIARSDSSSSVESVSVVKSKRLRKRRKSSSAKESDHQKSDDSSSDLPEEDDPDCDDKDENTATNSYLVRGEAVGKVRKTAAKKPKTVSMSRDSEKHSDDDFISKLSSIVHGGTMESDENDAESVLETSNESVGARDIVESVLQRRHKRTKSNANVTTKGDTLEVTQENAQDTNEKHENEKTNWTVTDQVGETDEMDVDLLADYANDSASSVAGNTTSIANDSNHLGIVDDQSGEKTTAEKEKKRRKNRSNKTAEPIVQPVNETIDPESGWNEEMRRFYNDSWGGEDFSTRSICSRMPKSLTDWPIRNSDKHADADYRRYSRNRSVRCMNCREKGHYARDCGLPRSVRRCFVCGNDGHLEPRCPNTICLNCGKKTRTFIFGCVDCNRSKDMTCYTCNQRGHIQAHCPDQWRRYHSTIDSDKPLVEQREQKMPARLKYCCLCAKQGHIAEKCNAAYRICQAPISSVFVHNYRPIYRARAKADSPKFTILTSSLNNFSFNYGNDVHDSGNTIYARFKRAVNLSTEQNKKIQQSNDVQVVETVPTALDFGNKKIESNTTVSGESINNENGNVSVELENISTDEMQNLSAADASANIINVNDDEDEIEEISDSEVEKSMTELDDKLKTLNGLKEKISARNQLSTNAEPEGDSNYSFSDFYKPASPEKLPIDDVLPDFIPLSSNEPDKFVPTRSPTPPVNNENDNIECDAKVFLTLDHTKILATPDGTQFLQTTENQFNVEVRTEWSKIGKVLVIHGLPVNQEKFHSELIGFFAKHEKKPNCSATNATSVNLPKNREALIKFVREHLIQLDSCSDKSAAFVSTYYNKLRKCDDYKSKAMVKRVAQLRRQINLILFGKYGFADGRIHLLALEDCLRELLQCTETNAPGDLRKRTIEHMNYIFSSVDHDNYEDMIEKYHQLRKQNLLPVLTLDRKLLGLKIMVRTNPLSISTNKVNSVNFSDDLSALDSSVGNQKSVKHTSKLSVNMPSSIDIQINVSAPSSYQNESAYRTDSQIPQKNGVLSKWKY